MSVNRMLVGGGAGGGERVKVFVRRQTKWLIRNLERECPKFAQNYILGSLTNSQLTQPSDTAPMPRLYLCYTRQRHMHT